MVNWGQNKLIILHHMGVFGDLSTCPEVGHTDHSPLPLNFRMGPTLRTPSTLLHSLLLPLSEKMHSTREDSFSRPPRALHITVTVLFPHSPSQWRRCPPCSLAHEQVSLPLRRDNTLPICSTLKENRVESGARKKRL